MMVARDPVSRPARFDVRCGPCTLWACSSFWIAVWCLCVAAAPVAAQPADGVLVKSDIIAMSEGGLRSEFIVSLIESRTSAFHVEVKDLVRLAAAGRDHVIVAMMEAAEYTVDASPPVEPETERRLAARTRWRAPAADCGSGRAARDRASRPARSPAAAGVARRPVWAL